MRKSCDKCPLGAGRLMVPPSGPLSAPIMFLGEAPGEAEDRLGVPFVGRSGNVLAGLLELLGLRREQVLITNICWCRPPENRTPTLDEATTCKSNYLWPLLGKLTRLTLVITLGGTAASHMGYGTKSIYKIAGIAREWLFGAYWWYPMVHPAATFRSRVGQERWREDGRRLRRLLDRDFFGIRRRHGPKRREHSG